jgi:glycine dehydrogenase subunit 1
MNYSPITENDREEMLKRIGVRSINDLIMDLKPPLNEKLDLSEPMSELELMEHMRII